jgi:hypothetical protein
MWYGQDDTGDYDTGTANSDALTTPYILLEDAQAFTFFSWYETEEPGHFYDLKDVYIILPDGSWEMLGYVSGVMNEWVWYSFDISAYNGLLVRFAFFFDTVDNILNNFRGWYIDDIIIFGEAHVKKFHDLEAMITVPDIRYNDESGFIEVQVSNIGLNDETNVVLELWIDETLVAMSFYPTLNIDETGYLYYWWTPTETKEYNITAYAIPVPEEIYTINNVYTVFVTVLPPPIIDFELGDFIDLNYFGAPLERDTYLYFVDDEHVYMESVMFGYDYTSMIVNIYTRYVTEGYWEGTYYIGQIETNIEVGDTIDVLNYIGTVVGTTSYNWHGESLEAWELTIAGYSAYFHKETGVLLWWGYMDITLEDTNMISLEHDLAVSLETPEIAVPNEPLNLPVIIENRGKNDETDISVEIYINGILENTLEIPFLASGATEIVMYSYTPISVGVYEFLASVIPVSGELYITNNVASDTSMIIFGTLIGDFEGTIEGWTWDGLWHLINEANPYGEVYSPIQSMWYGQDVTGNYDTGSINSGTLISPSIELASYASYIAFYSWYETESIYHTFDVKDVYIILPDDSWVMLGYVSGLMNEWVLFYFDIEMYAGMTVQFAFKFDTVDSLYNNYRGWFIDDIMLLEDLPIVESLIDFELGDWLTLDYLGGVYFQFTYEYNIDPTHVYVSQYSAFDDYTYWMSVDITTRYINDGDSWWVGTYYPTQIETNIDIGDTVFWFDTIANVVGTVFYDWNGMLLEAWILEIPAWGAMAYHHKGTGLWIYYFDGYDEWYLGDTNMIEYVPACANEDDPTAIADDPTAFKDDPTTVEDDPTAVEDDPTVVENDPTVVEDDPISNTDENDIPSDTEISTNANNNETPEAIKEPTLTPPNESNQDNKQAEINIKKDNGNDSGIPPVWLLGLISLGQISLILIKRH